MAKIIETHKFVAYWTSMGMGIWGNGVTRAEAVEELCREARDISMLKKDAKLNFVVYSVGVGNYLQFDDNGVAEYDAADVKIGIARPVNYIKQCDIRKPLTTLRLCDWRDAYGNNGEAVDALLKERTDYKAA